MDVQSQTAGASKNRSAMLVLKQKLCDGTFFFFLIYLFIYLFLAALGLCCCTQTFSSCGERGLLFVVVRGLLIVVASLVVEHRLSCSAACRIFPDQGSNPCPPHRQADS